MSANRDSGTSKTAEEVKFVVGPQKTVIMVNRSDLLKAVPLIQNKDEYHEDISEESFRVFMDLISGNGFEITSMTEAWELFELAKKHNCMTLHYACNEYIKTNYENEWAPAIYEHAKANGLMQLKMNCRDYIASNFRAVIAGEQFSKVAVTTVAEFFAAEVDVSEFELAEALIRYARARKTDLGMESLRSYVKVATDKIRFGEMSPQQLMALEGIDHLLTKDEIFSIVKGMVGEFDRGQGTLIPRTETMTAKFNYLDDVNPIKKEKFALFLSFSEDVILKYIFLDDFFKNRVSKVTLTIDMINAQLHHKDLEILIEHKVNKDNIVRLDFAFKEDLSLNTFSMKIDSTDGMQIHGNRVQKFIEKITIKRIHPNKKSMLSTDAALFDHLSIYYKTE